MGTPFNDSPEIMSHAKQASSPDINTNSRNERLIPRPKFYSNNPLDAMVHHSLDDPTLTQDLLQENENSFRIVNNMMMNSIETLPRHGSEEIEEDLLVI